MGSLADMIDQDRRARSVEPAPQAQAYEGVIEADPVSINSKVAVTVPALDDGTHSRGLAPWMPRAGAIQEMPAQGDRALVVFDQRGAPWVVAWWPEGVL